MSDTTPFSVEINEAHSEAHSVGKLKQEIKKTKAPDFNDVATDNPTLYKINVDISDDNKNTMHDVSQPDFVFNPKLEVNPTLKISKYFEQDSEKNVNTLVESPQSESIDPRAWVPSLRIRSPLFHSH